MSLLLLHNKAQPTRTARRLFIQFNYYLSTSTLICCLHRSVAPPPLQPLCRLGTPRNEHAICNWIIADSVLFHYSWSSILCIPAENFYVFLSHYRCVLEHEPQLPKTFLKLIRHNLRTISQSIIILVAEITDKKFQGSRSAFKNFPAFKENKQLIVFIASLRSI